MASRPEPTTSTTSCWQCETSAANVVPTLLWSSAMSMRIRDLQNFSCQERRRGLADMSRDFRVGTKEKALESLKLSKVRMEQAVRATKTVPAARVAESETGVERIN